MSLALPLAGGLEGDGVLVLDVPPDFHQVPLEASTEERVAAQLDVLDDMGLTDSGQREALSLYLEALAGRLGTGQVAATAFCAVAVDGHPSTATLTVAVRDLGTGDAGLAVMGTAEALRRQGRYADVRIVALGASPAVAAVSERPTLPGEPVMTGDTGETDETDEAGETGEAGAVVREMCVIVPVPGSAYAAMVTVSTPCLRDWDVYERLALDVGRSVHLERDRRLLTG